MARSSSQSRQGAKSNAKLESPATPYVLKPHERKIIDAFQARWRKAKPLPKQIVELENGVPNLRDDHPDATVGATLAMEAFGLTRVGELTSLLQHAVELTQRDRKPDAPRLNEFLALVAAVEPRDSIEAMLATQMAAVHNATLRAARLLRGSETISQQDSANASFNKLARTFAAQVEALKRHRSKGEQKVVVEHVTVNDGGQAIVGAVNAGGGVTEEE